MKTYNEQELNELALEHFNNYESSTKVFAFTDGNIFNQDSENAALLHKSTSKVDFIIIHRELDLDSTELSESSNEGNADSLNDDDVIPATQVPTISGDEDTTKVADAPKSAEEITTNS